MNSAWTSLLPPTTVAASHTGDGLIPLTEHTIITITGRDAIKFLQGQCTCDATQLTQGYWQLGAHCNVKGRMLSSFTMALLADDCVGLRVHSSIAKSTAQALQRYIVFSKAQCEISQALALGIVGAIPESISSNKLEGGQFSITPAGTVLQHSNNLGELWVSTHCALGLDNIKPLLAQNPIYAASRWQLLMIEQGRAEVQQATSDAHLPQAFNFDLIGGINFKKGCYTGQEIIARVHYKGQSKQRVHALQLDEQPCEPISVGQRIINAEGKAVGEVAAIASNATGYALLACTKAFDAEAPSLFVAGIVTNTATDQDADNSPANRPVHTMPLQPLPLPYAIP